MSKLSKLAEIFPSPRRLPTVNSIMAGFREMREQLLETEERHSREADAVQVSIETLTVRRQDLGHEMSRAKRMRNKLDEFLEA